MSQEIIDRWEAIEDIRAVLNVENPALELKRIIEEDDQTKLGQLEADWASYQSQLAIENQKEARKVLGQRARKACENALDVVAGWNIERSLTEDQVSSMTSSFASILSLLQANRILSAKESIEAIVPDGSLITQDMKDEILSELVL